MVFICYVPELKYFSRRILLLLTNKYHQDIMYNNIIKLYRLLLLLLLWQLS